jgi:hypothetical protein
MLRQSVLSIKHLTICFLWSHLYFFLAYDVGNRLVKVFLKQSVAYVIYSAVLLPFVKETDMCKRFSSLQLSIFKASFL